MRARCADSPPTPEQTKYTSTPDLESQRLTNSIDQSSASTDDVLSAPSGTPIDIPRRFFCFSENDFPQPEWPTKPQLLRKESPTTPSKPLTGAALRRAHDLFAFLNWWGAACIHSSRYIVVATFRRLPPHLRLSWVRRSTYVLFICCTYPIMKPGQGRAGRPTDEARLLEKEAR